MPLVAPRHVERLAALRVTHRRERRVRRLNARRPTLRERRARWARFPRATVPDFATFTVIALPFVVRLPRGESASGASHDVTPTGCERRDGHHYCESADHSGTPADESSPARCSTSKTRERTARVSGCNDA